MPGLNNATIRGAIKRVERRERAAKAAARTRNTGRGRLAMIRSRRRAA